MAEHPDPLGTPGGSQRPPADRGKLGDGVPCAFCNSTDTRLLSPFGGQLSVAQYWCNRCRTGFEYMKWG